MSWDINETTIDGHLFFNVASPNPCHVLFSGFVSQNELSDFGIDSPEDIKSEDRSDPGYTEGDFIHITMVKKNQAGTNSHSHTSNREYPQAGEQVCYILIEYVSETEKKQKRVKRTSQTVSDAYPISG